MSCFKSSYNYIGVKSPNEGMVDMTGEKIQAVINDFIMGSASEIKNVEPAGAHWLMEHIK